MYDLNTGYTTAANLCIFTGCLTQRAGLALSALSRLSGQLTDTFAALVNQVPSNQCYNFEETRMTKWILKLFDEIIRSDNLSSRIGLLRAVHLDEAKWSAEFERNARPGKVHSEKTQWELARAHRLRNRRTLLVQQASEHTNDTRKSKKKRVIEFEREKTLCQRCLTKSM